MGFIVLMLTPFFIHAQIPDPVKFDISNAPESAKAGEVFTVEVKATIEENWNLYSILNAPDAGPYPTSFTANSDNFVIAGEIIESEAKVDFDPNFETELGLHANRATFKIPVAVKTNVDGAQNLDVEVFYQACDDRVCLPPKKKSIIAAVNIDGVADEVYAGLNDAEHNSTSGDTAVISDKKDDFGQDGILSFMWVAILAGFAALLTPCVFPIIPLTVSYFSNQKEAKKPVGKALLFGLAIVATFTLLGLLLALMLGASGAQRFASNPIVNIIIATILIVFAVSLFGLFELRLPYKFTNFLNKKSNESSGLMGILFLALTISAVSFSCTAPFVGAVFAATVGGEWFYPVLGMIGFSAAFASPFVLFAMFPSWLESMPKSGSWMNLVKVILGFILLATSLKFISDVDLVWQWELISRPFVIAAWIVIFILAGLYTLGFITLQHETKPEYISVGRLVLSMPLLIFSFYLLPGLFGASLGVWDSWLPPKQPTDVSIVSSIGTTNTSSAADADIWSEDLEASIEMAIEENKPVFIDYSGYTCTNCRAMEANIFPLEEVQQQFEKMVLVRLYTDGGKDAQKNQRIQFEMTGNVALPTYVIYDPVNEKVIKQALGYTKKDKFVSFLKSGISEFK